MTTSIKVAKALGLVVRQPLQSAGERVGSIVQRRGFLALTAFGLYLPALGARAQPDAKTRRIALIEAGALSANQHFVDAFMASMREFGYVPGKNIVIDVRWAEGRVEGFRRALDELIGLRPEVVVVASTLGAVEARKATTSIPVVFTAFLIRRAMAWSPAWLDPAAISPGWRALPATASAWRSRRCEKYAPTGCS